MDITNRNGLGLTFTQQQKLFEIAEAIQKKGSNIARFNTADRLHIVIQDEEKEEIWDWFEFVVVKIPDIITKTNHQAWVLRCKIMEFIQPFKEYPGAPKAQHPVDYIYEEFTNWLEKQK